MHNSYAQILSLLGESSVVPQTPLRQRTSTSARKSDDEYNSFHDDDKGKLSWDNLLWQDVYN